jgi:hypothetical protein
MLGRGRPAVLLQQCWAVLMIGETALVMSAARDAELTCYANPVCRLCSFLVGDFTSIQIYHPSSKPVRLHGFLHCQHGRVRYFGQLWVSSGGGPAGYSGAHACRVCNEGQHTVLQCYQIDPSLCVICWDQVTWVAQQQRQPQQEACSGYWGTSTTCRLCIEVRIYVVVISYGVTWSRTGPVPRIEGLPALA